MKTLFGFLANFLLFVIFVFDVSDYYFLGSGLNVISNDINRVFVMWFGFIVTIISTIYFSHSHFVYMKKYSLSSSDSLVRLDNVNRVEVIDEKGRSYVSWDENNKTELSFQDNKRTLKIYVTKKGK